MTLNNLYLYTKDIGSIIEKKSGATKIIKQSNGPESFVQKEEANHFCLNIFAFEANKNLSKH